MSDTDRHDAWSAGRSYDEYMGRWSQAVAIEFTDWLDQPGGLDWLDVGCGTGALTATVMNRSAPRSIVGVDPSDGFVAHAAAAFPDERADFRVGTAGDLPLDDHEVDVVVSALVYNFLPDRVAALEQFRRVVRPGGLISFYVWDYPAGGVGFIDAFWKAAASLDDAAAQLDEADRFPFCTADTLRLELASAGLAGVDVRSIEVPTRFDSFEAFWHPFTLGAGPAPGYLANLELDRQLALRDRLRVDLGAAGPVELTARAWAARAHP